jgi:uncharacterized protein YaaR (DUF327 family)
MTETKEILPHIEVAIRNLQILAEKLKKAHGTQFEPNATEMTRIFVIVNTIKRKSADLTQAI